MEYGSKSFTFEVALKVYLNLSLNHDPLFSSSIVSMSMADRLLKSLWNIFFVSDHDLLLAIEVCLNFLVLDRHLVDRVVILRLFAEY